MKRPQLFALIAGLTLSINCLATEIDVNGIVGITFDDEVASVAITTDFTIHGLTVSPDGLTLTYGADIFKLFGAAVVKLGEDEITVSFGDENSPGLQITNGTFDQVLMGLTADFNLKSISFSPDGLTFQWDNGNQLFEIFGGANVGFDGETMDITLGDADSPGIEINNGTVDKINLGVTADFNLKSFGFSPDGLTFQWDKVSGNFEMFGAATVSFDSESMDITLGDDSTPGIEIVNGAVTSIDLGVTADFSLKSMSFSPDGLTFKWDQASDNFEMFGSATLSFDGQTMTVTLGDDDNPGIEMVNGVIDHLNIDISANFSLKNMDFTADGLTFLWDKNSNFFEIYGAASASFDGESIEVTLGNADNPGIEISGGILQHINLGVSTDFTLKSMEFEADGLTFEWDKSSNHYEIYGSTSARFDGEEIDIGLGDANDAGIVVKNKVIQHINMTVDANFSLKAFTFKPTNLTFHYDKNQSHFEMYGSAKFTIEGHDAVISMGNNSNPGLVFQNGDLKHINLSITEDFSLKGLTVKTDDVGVVWDSGNDYFDFHGDIQLALSGEDIDADMGTADDPGMQFRNGKLHSFDVTINSDFKLGNLEVTTRDVEVNYKSSKFYITGEIEVDEVWSVIVDLGEDGSNGLELDVSGSHDKIKLTDFKIEVDHVDLGAIDFKKIEISFRNDVIHDAELDVSIPPGYEVDAKMTFAGSPAKLNSIDISFDATSFETAIPIGDTGIELVHIEGGMFNLADPSTPVILYREILPGINVPIDVVTGVYFEGSVAFTFGGPVSLAGREAALIYQEDDVTISGKGVFLEASLLIGAYRHGDNSWRSILGDGSIAMNLIWGRSYSVSANMKIPSDPLVEFNAGAKLTSSGDFDALIDVKLKVPHSIPIVGGKTLGSIDGGIRYNPHHLSSSYGAGWASYWFFGRHYFGARYKFSNRKVDIIGSGTVNSIKSEISRELGNMVNTETADLFDPRDENGREGVEETEWVKEVRSFELPPDKTSLFVELDLRKVVDEVYVSVIGPDGFYDIYEVQKTEVAEDEPPIMELQDQITKVENDSALNLLIVNHEPENDSIQNHFSSLAPGQYDLLVSYRSTNNVDSLGIRVNYFHPVPIAEISAEVTNSGKISVDMEYWAQFPDSTLLTVFWNDTAAYGGHQLATIDYGEVDEHGFGETNLLFNPSKVVHGDKLYFYYVIQDSTNAPHYSEFTSPIVHESSVSGTVTITNANEETVHAGIMVFIDENENGFYDTKGTASAFEPMSITDSEGKIHFNDLVMGQTYTIDIVVPFGYSLAEGEPGKYTFTYTGETQSINFNITKD